MADGLQDLLDAELGRRGLIPFAKRVWPGFKSPRHVEYIAGLLQKLESGDLTRLSISLQVRIGKTSLCSMVFPAFFLGRHPSAKVIIASHSESLATMMSRRVLNIIQSEEYPFDVKIAEDSKSIQRFSTSQRGELFACGAQASVSGRGADLLVLDDILADGLSSPEKEKTWTQLQESFLTRLEPGGKVLLVGSRLASDDIPGRLMESDDASTWKFISLPARAQHPDPLGREEGEPIWPDRISLEELEHTRLEVGEKVWSAQYQQRPVPIGGLTFKTEWLENRYSELPTSRADVRKTQNEDDMQFFWGVAPRTTRPLVIQAIDSAWKHGAQHDRTVMATLLTDGVSIYVKDILAGRFQYTDLKTIVAEQFKKHKPARVYVEEASSGYALLEDLRKQTPIPVIGVSPGRDSKTARAEALTGLFESGKVLWPQRAPWLEDALNEFIRFPAGRHDDVVDAVCLGIKQITLQLQREAETRNYQRVRAQLENSIMNL